MMGIVVEDRKEHQKVKENNRRSEAREGGLRKY